MSLHNETLYSLIGRVEANRPGAGSDRYIQALNDAVRYVINRRTYWTDLRRRTALSVPAQYATGTVSLTTRSNVVTGVGTAWPVSDIVNTTILDQVVQPGAQDVGLASMAGVTVDSSLVIDSGASVEVVPVAGIVPFSGRVYANFQLPHASGVSVTVSSLAGRQLRTGYNNPVFTVTGVASPTQLFLDNAWGGLPLTAIAYYILQMYYTVFPNIRQFIAVVDQQQGTPLNFSTTQQELNNWDPQRSDNSDPICFASIGPNASGNMQYELWPCPTSGRQIAVLASLQWPPMINPDDMPPPFLEPTIFTDLASAALLRSKLSKDDPFSDPKRAQDFERLAKEAIQVAIDGDEALAIQDYRSQMNSMFPSGSSDFWRSHDPDVMSGWR